MIEVNDLVKVFGRFRAVDGVSLDVAAGEIHGFLGPNGAGKTTTIRMVAGLLAPTAGRVVIDGHDLAREPEAAKAAPTSGSDCRLFAPGSDVNVTSPVRASVVTANGENRAVCSLVKLKAPANSSSLSAGLASPSTCAPSASTSVPSTSSTSRHCWT